MPNDAMLQMLRDRLGAETLLASEFRGMRRFTTPSERLFELLKLLKEEMGFDQLTELTAVDYLKYPNARDRFGVVYGLLNMQSGERVWVKTFLNEPELAVPSVFALWKGADWLEREVYDMYGIVFEGHPDLRRILMPEEFASYPMRKDYPLRGRGERHNFEVITRAES